jgi:hypothetical protein
MLLLITGSYDGTADRLVLSYGPGVFRLNYDLWRHYHLSFDNDGWSIRNPAGLEISSKTVSAVFWWKAFAFFTSDDRFIKSEVKYVFREIYGWCCRRGIAKGNSIDFHNTLGKMNILGLAKQYFSVPETLVTFNGEASERMSGRSVVAKSLSSERNDDGGSLLTTEVNFEQLDYQYPWYLQEKVDSGWDVTILYCNAKAFAFRRSRAALKGLDWRAEQSMGAFLEEEWELIPLEMSVLKSLNMLSRDMGVEFGRYDFMIESNGGQLIFLEFNANGQWVFLDPYNKHGLLEAVTDWLRH